MNSFETLGSENAVSTANACLLYTLSKDDRGKAVDVDVQTDAVPVFRCQFSLQIPPT
jgi:hypothetical protein